MKALQLTRPSLDAFHPTALPECEPARGEVLIGMRAAALNFIDVAVATGRYPGATFPLVPVADGAGEVLAVGPGVQMLAVGDRVAIHSKALWPSGRGTAVNARAMRGVNLPGSLRERAAVAADSVVRLASHLSWAQGASLPITATTAWNALKTADIGAGSVIAVLGTGGAALSALQLAKARGARVIVTSSSDEKLARASAMGADHGVNYIEHGDWDREVLEMTGGVGVDLVLDTAGAATITRSLNAVRHGGTVFSIGFLSGSRTEIDLLTVISKSIRLQGNNTGSAADLAEAMAAIDAHLLQPVVDRDYGIGDVRSAYEAMASGRNAFGKQVISLDF